MAIGLSNEGIWSFNKACSTPWCHAAVHFEVKMSLFPAAFQDHRRNNGGTSLKEAVFLQRFKTTGEPRRTTTNKFRCVLSRLARCAADLVSKKGLFWAVFVGLSGSRYIVAQNRHASSSKPPGSNHASRETGFVPFRAV